MVLSFWRGCFSVTVGWGRHRDLMEVWNEASGKDLWLALEARSDWFATLKQSSARESLPHCVGGWWEVELHCTEHGPEASRLSFAGKPGKPGRLECVLVVWDSRFEPLCS